MKRIYYVQEMIYKNGKTEGGAVICTFENMNDAIKFASEHEPPITLRGGGVDVEPIKDFRGNKHRAYKFGDDIISGWYICHTIPLYSKGECKE